MFLVVSKKRVDLNETQGTHELCAWEPRGHVLYPFSDRPDSESRCSGVLESGNQMVEWLEASGRARAPRTCQKHHFGEVYDSGKDLKRSKRLIGSFQSPCSTPSDLEGGDHDTPAQPSHQSEPWDLQKMIMILQCVPGNFRPILP